MKNKVLVIAMCILFVGCKTDKVAPAVVHLDSASLLFPEENQVCTQGTVLSPMQSAVTFKWNAVTNADSYELVLTDLLTKDSTMQTCNTTQLQLTLGVNTPYAWYIISRSAKTNNTSQSSSWKFYNSGPGITSYAPFPAAITAPLPGQTITPLNGTVTLSWKGSDPDNDIINYDVYFGTTTNPAIYKAGETGSSLNLPVVSGATYYWNIVTRDAAGNSSASGIVQFYTN